jgi:serine protease Do
LRQSGKVVRGFLGIYFTELTPDIVEAKDLHVSKGVIVDQIMKDSPAENAGIEQGDVVVGFNGKDVESGSQFQFMVAGTVPGSVVKLEIIRAGQRKTVEVRVGERESSELAQSPSEEKEPWLGLTVEGLDGLFARQNDIKDDEGVVVVEVEPGSPADDKDLQSGDVVLEIDNQKILDLKDYSRVAGELKDRQKAILFLVKRGERAFYSALKPEKK